MSSLTPTRERPESRDVAVPRHCATPPLIAELSHAVAGRCGFYVERADGSSRLVLLADAPDHAGVRRAVLERVSDRTPLNWQLNTIPGARLGALAEVTLRSGGRAYADPLSLERALAGRPSCSPEPLRATLARRVLRGLVAEPLSRVVSVDPQLLLSTALPAEASELLSTAPSRSAVTVLALLCAWLTVSFRGAALAAEAAKTRDPARLAQIALSVTRKLQQRYRML